MSACACKWLYKNIHNVCALCMCLIDHIIMMQVSMYTYGNVSMITPHVQGLTITAANSSSVPCFTRGCTVEGTIIAH